MRKREAKLHPRRTALLMAVYALLLALGSAMPLASSSPEGARARAQGVEQTVDHAVEPSSDLRGT